MKSKKNKVVVVTVTYGNRFNILEQVVNTVSIFPEVVNIVIVDNGSPAENHDKLKDLSDNNKKIVLVRNDENMGSAKGFKMGIETALEINEGEYIWLLDDDNFPDQKALDILVSEANTISNSEIDKTCLLSVRKDRRPYINSIQCQDPRLSLSSYNSYMGFNLFSKFHRLYKCSVGKKKGSDYKKGVVLVAPYGGMFFHKSLISLIGLPDERYYLYFDDHDFSYRITLLDGKIIALLDSTINDISGNWIGNVKRSGFVARLFNKNKFRFYYSTRNQIYFEKKFLIQNPFLYIINLLVYNILFVCLSVLVLNFKNLKVYISATCDALSERLGYNSKYSNLNEKK